MYSSAQERGHSPMSHHTAEGYQSQHHHHLKSDASDRALVHVSGHVHRELGSPGSDLSSPRSPPENSPWTNTPKNPWQEPQGQSIAQAYASLQYAKQFVSSRRSSTKSTKSKLRRGSGAGSNLGSFRGDVSPTQVHKESSSLVQELTRALSSYEEGDSEDSDEEEIQIEPNRDKEASAIAKNLISINPHRAEKTQQTWHAVPDWTKHDFEVVGLSADHELAIIAEVSKYFWFCFGTVKDDSESVYILRPEFIATITACLRVGAESWDLEAAEEEAAKVFAAAIPKYLLVTQKMDFLMCTEAFAMLAAKHCTDKSAESKALWLSYVGNRVLRMKQEPAVATDDSGEGAEYIAALGNPVMDNVRGWSRKHRRTKQTKYGSSQDVASLCDPFALCDICEHVEILTHDKVERDPQFLPIRGGRKGLFGTEEAVPEDSDTSEEEQEQEPEPEQLAPPPPTPEPEQYPDRDLKASEDSGAIQAGDREALLWGQDADRDKDGGLVPFPQGVPAADLISVVVTSPVASPSTTSVHPAPLNVDPPRRHPPLQRRARPRKAAGARLGVGAGSSWICPFTLRLHRANVPHHPHPKPLGRRPRPLSAAVVEETAGEEEEENGEEEEKIGEEEDEEIGEEEEEEKIGEEEEEEAAAAAAAGAGEEGEGGRGEMWREEEEVRGESWPPPPQPSPLLPPHTAARDHQTARGRAGSGGGREGEGEGEGESMDGALPAGGHAPRFSRSSHASAAPSAPSALDRDHNLPVLPLHPTTLLPPPPIQPSPSARRALASLPPPLRPFSHRRPPPPRPHSCDPADGRRAWLVPTRVRFDPCAPAPRPHSAHPLHPHAHPPQHQQLRPIKPPRAAHRPRAEAEGGGERAGSAGAVLGRGGRGGSGAGGEVLRQLAAPPARAEPPVRAGAGAGAGAWGKEKEEKETAKARLQRQLALYAAIRPPPRKPAEDEEGQRARRRSSVAEEGVTWKSLGQGTALYS